MHRLPPLNALRAFEAVARQGTLTRAAEELHVTPTAVSRHIRNLEESLNVRLFDREGGQLLLTSHGKTYARTLARAFDMMGEATDLLSQASARTQITLRAFTTLLVRWMIPRLPDFQLKHPEVDLRLTTAFDAVDFERDKVDLGVRYGQGQWPGLHATRLFSDELVAVGNTAMRDRFADRPLAEALEASTLLVHTLHLDDWPDWFEAAGLEEVVAQNRQPFDDMSLIYQSALDGIGVGMVQRRYLTRDLDEGRLHLLSPVVLRRERGFYLVCRQETASNAAVQSFIKWIEDRRDD
jgi:LysR family transcriptional regulator, glycine cleavage system transcriptional activator